MNDYLTQSHLEMDCHQLGSNILPMILFLEYFHSFQDFSLMKSIMLHL